MHENKENNLELKTIGHYRHQLDSEARRSLPAWQLSPPQTCYQTNKQKNSYGISFVYVFYFVGSSMNSHRIKHFCHSTGSPVLNIILTGCNSFNPVTLLHSSQDESIHCSVLLTDYFTDHLLVPGNGLKKDPVVNADAI